MSDNEIRHDRSAPSERRLTRRRWWVLGLVVGLLVAAAAVAPTPATAAAGLTRLHWAASLGRIANVSPWVRNAQYTLTPTSASAGSVSVALTQYDPSVAGTKTVVGHAGPCNGVAACPIYSATSSMTTTWSGTYTFTGADDVGTLAISWSHGPSESWALAQVRAGTLGEMTLLSAVYPGSDPNLGKGYGSTQPFSYYKTHGAVDSVAPIFYGTYDHVVEGSTAQTGSAWNLNVGGMTGTSSYPKGLLLLQSAGVVNPRCGVHDHITGNMYLMWVTNAGRLMSQNNWFRCLVQAETGYYTRDMHVAMLNQVIDDDGGLVGVVGVESSASGGWTVALIRALAG